MNCDQKKIVDVYRVVKEVITNINTRDRSRIQVIVEAKRILKNKFMCYKDIKYSALNYNFNRRDRKFKMFVKNKHYNMGLPSKEIAMLDKMINNVVDKLQLNETSLSDLNDSVFEMSAISHRAEGINNACEDIIEKLNKISDYLDNKCETI